ncbi:hypothetical protein ACP4OV_026711 [Aristida adscensionis]
MANPVPRQRLYLVFDDWELGYSIRRLNLHRQMAAAVAVDRSERPPPPAVFRLEAPHDLPMYFAAAFGTTIMAAHPRGSEKAPHPLVPEDAVSLFDVRSRAFSLGPRPSEDPRHPMYIDVDGHSLFALGDFTWEVLSKPAPEAIGCSNGEAAPEASREWAWERLDPPPCDSQRVYAHAVHPDDGTIFISCYSGFHGSSTVTFGTSCSSKWQLYGHWMLPFFGRAHFDPELNAWVGISADPMGYVSMCTVPPLDSDPSTRRSPVAKICKERLYGLDPAEYHVGATLVYMGGSSQFCLVECVFRDRYLFRVTTFSLKFDINGELTTGHSSRVQYYRLPEGNPTDAYAIHRHPVAFWM